MRGVLPMAMTCLDTRHYGTRKRSSAFSCTGRLSPFPNMGDNQCLSGY